MRTPSSGCSELKRCRVDFAGANAHRVIERRDENLAITNLAGLRGRRDRLDGLVCQLGSAPTTSILILGGSSPHIRHAR